MNSICIVGFDSAWGDRAQGAICSITLAKDGAASFVPPFCSTFDNALKFIISECNRCDVCIIAIDQPTIVQNDMGGGL